MGIERPPQVSRQIVVPTLRGSAAEAALEEPGGGSSGEVSGVGGDERSAPGQSGLDNLVSVALYQAPDFSWRVRPEQLGFVDGV